MNICQCGAQAGYPHDPTCPYPLYHDSPVFVAHWNAVSKLKKIVLEELKDATPAQIEKYLKDLVSGLKC